MRPISLDIDTLALHGLPPEQAPLVRAALERELSARLQAGQVPPARPLVSVTVARGLPPAAVARQVADAIFGGPR